MISSKDKRNLCILTLFTFFVTLLNIIPFNVLFDRLRINIDNIKGVELIFKFIIIPIIILLISLYVLKERNKYFEKSNFLPTIFIKMIYVPISMYLSSLLAWIGSIIYASETYSSNIVALFGIILTWTLSVIIILLFGIYTKWLYNLSFKQLKISNIVYYIISLCLMIVCFIIIQNINEIKNIEEVDAFIQLIFYMILYFVVIIIIWHSIYTNKKQLILRSSNEEIAIKNNDEPIKNVQDDFVEYCETISKSYPHYINEQIKGEKNNE